MLMTFPSRRWAGRLPRLPLLVALVFLAVFTLTRLGLAILAGPDALPLALWPGVFGLGLWFDAAVVAFFLAPICLYEALLPNRWRTARLHGALRLIWLWLTVAALLFGAVAEATFWLEFSTRFNFIAVDYLLYTREVIGNVRQSYPVGWLLAAIGVAAALLTWWLAHAVRRADRVALTWTQRGALLAAAVAAPLASLALAGVEQMQGAGNAYADELAGNGLFTLAAAMRRNELDYDRFYRTSPGPQAAATLARVGVRRQFASAAAPLPRPEPIAAPFLRRPRNVVLISVESLSARFLGSFGNPAGLTPRLDALARDGLLYTQLYATGTRTVRGLEALSLGTPPIPGQAIVRRPGNEHLATVGEVLRRQGYETLFLYGGYGYFDNMNAYFAGNDYRVVDRTDFPKASIGFANVWGVADEFLFDNSLVQLDRAHAAGKPFLAQIMTTSNHRPYTYPDGRIDIPSPGKREGGVKYTDYAIGRFIDQARRKPWFDDTLFVIVADHCASAAGKTTLPVAGYHIPLILYAPALLKPGRDDRVASQIDIPPTLLDVMGLPGDDHFFGQSLFEQREENRRAFISNYQELGYLKAGKLVVLGPKQRVDTFSIDANGDATPTAPDPRLRDEAVAYYQTAFKAFKEGALKLGAIGLPR